ncbi:YdeI/OmpD-associated family protein [Polluticoccus soli]|uniref:YdeI/OmpD-associated family protein n=1 Tax=Polluticoccus soli TaxID=3034150 RepID=UPI0023E1842E|nr:YdeI/OmpD-associated family protein [Flavipsychrobacter sp. JY13-12]
MKPLVDDNFLLERFEGKGGWTYARIPQVARPADTPLGWVRVKGTIDDFELKKYHLAPMSGGGLFLPVKAEVRKKIKKEAGDKVHIILYPDTDVLEIPAELELCLHDEPKALAFFNKLSESQRKYYINWIYSAKKEETRVNRLAQTISRLQQGLKMYDKTDED